MLLVKGILKLVYYTSFHQYIPIFFNQSDNSQKQNKASQNNQYTFAIKAIVLTLFNLAYIST
jgi:hypothetical protein